MFYQRNSNNEIHYLFEGYNSDMKKIVKSCICTDGKVDSVDDNSCHVVFTGLIPKHNKNNLSNIDKEVITVSNYVGKRVNIVDANYISIVYYVLSEEEDKWYLFDSFHRVGANFNLLNEYNFAKYQIGSLPLPYVLDQEPQEIYTRELNEKVKSKILK